MTRRSVIVPALLVLAAAVLAVRPAGAGASHALIQGSGSSWSANAINQWIADVQPNGMQVVYTANGSAQGRKDFGYRTNDFAVSEIGFQGVDPGTGDSDTPQGRAYAYLPIVAGGTAFPYQIRVQGQLVRDLRLSGRTLAKIFTNQIGDWSDPAITADNNGRALPSLPIIPVVHSEGSGSSAHFSDYLDKEFPDIWRPFNGGPGLTEYYPRKGNAVAQSGSDGVMNFISSAAANGAIGFDEYSYALGQNYPVAQIENAAGYYSLPTQYNVAVALTQAIINGDKSSPNYLLQDLTNVYTYNDPRAYSLSSYSYMIIPTAPDDSKMTTAKRQTLADFLYYSICDGQKEMGPIGYSPLPVNLVQAGFAQIGKLHDADPNVDLTQRDVSTCHNPTFDPSNLNRNYLAEVAPQPKPCDHAGQGPCDAPASSSDSGGSGSTGTTVDPGSGTATDTSGNSTGDGSSDPSAVPTDSSAAASTDGSTSTSSDGSVATSTDGSPVSSSADPSGSAGAGGSDLLATDPSAGDQLGGTGDAPSSAGGGGSGAGPVSRAPSAAARARVGNQVAAVAIGDLPSHVTPLRGTGALVPLVLVLLAALIAGPSAVVRVVARRRRDP